MIANKLHFFTLLLLLFAAQHTKAAEDYSSKQKIKESDIIKAVPVSSDNKFQHQNKRGVSDISEDIVLGSAHPGSSSYLSPTPLSGFSPITSPYSVPYSGGHHFGSIYGASPFYSKSFAAASSYPTFKAPFSATYPANGISYGSLPAFPKLSYSNSYSGYPTPSYATAAHHNAIAYPSIQYPSYHNAAPLHGSYYHHQPAAVHSPVQASSVTHHGVFAQAPASPVIYGGYGNGIHKYGLAAAAPAVYAASEAGHVYHQPQIAYAAVQPSYYQSAIKPAVYSNVGPTLPTATIKPALATQHSPAGGAVSFASFSQHTGQKGPIYAAAPQAIAPQYAAYAHQYAPQQYLVSGGYKVAAASQPAPIYAQIPYQSGAIQYGSHLVQQPEGAKIAYQQVTQHK